MCSESNNADLLLRLIIAVLETTTCLLNITWWHVLGDYR